MMTTQSLIRALASLALAVSATLPARAQLPRLGEQPWIGYFAVHSSSRYIFSIDSFGAMQIQPVASGEPISHKYFVKIIPNLQETLPSGKIVNKRLDTESLETSDASTDKLQKTTYRAKITGDASFEVTVEQQRDIIYLTGRPLESGTIKNPLSLVFSIAIPDLYPGKLEPDGALSDREKKREAKALANKLKGDRISLKWTDGKSLRRDTTEGADADPKDYNGPGIAGLELDCMVFRKRKLLINASPGTEMTISKPESSEFYKGFQVQWAVNPDKDPDGKARLAIQMR